MSLCSFGLVHICSIIRTVCAGVRKSCKFCILKSYTASVDFPYLAVCCHCVNYFVTVHKANNTNRLVSSIWAAPRSQHTYIPVFYIGHIRLFFFIETNSLVNENEINKLNHFHFHNRTHLAIAPKTSLLFLSDSQSKKY